MTNPVYRMSSLGTCQRALAAQRLGYDALPLSSQDVKRLKHYSRLEAVASDQIEEMGIVFQPGERCGKCYPEDKRGIHVEIESTFFTLIGHLDGRAQVKMSGVDTWLPIEIKSLGKSSWAKFRKEQFAVFSNYAYQECAYLKAKNIPGIYWVMERDSGDNLKYVVNDFNKDVDDPRLKDFDRIILPVEFSVIEDKLNDIEVYAMDNTLPEGMESDDCWFCRYKFLCIKADDKKSKVETSPVLVEAAQNYKSAVEILDEAEATKAKARDTLLFHAKQNNIDKYRCSGLSISYRGKKVKTWLDESIIRKEAPPDLIRIATKQSEPFDDYTIRRLKE